MTLRFRFRGDDVGKKLSINLQRGYGRIADASRAALNEGQQRILIAGRADILAGGRFTKRWTDSLSARIEPVGVRQVNLIMTIFHKIPYAHVFEYGAKILGRPLLWIPLPWTGLKVRARDYPGSLFRVDREGKNPLLLDYNTAQPKYVGVKSVRLRRRFHIRPIIRRVAKQMPFLFKKAIRLARRK